MIVLFCIHHVLNALACQPLYIHAESLAFTGWSDGGEISIDCYSELQNLYVSTLPSLTAGID